MNSELKIAEMKTEVIKKEKTEEKAEENKKENKKEKIKLTEEEKKLKAKERYAIYRLTRDKSQKVDCECGSTLLLDNIARHKKSIKHIEYMKANIVLDNEGNIVYETVRNDVEK